MGQVLLDQRYFNGVGNYLRAEMMWMAKCAPFEKARAALELAKEEAEKKRKEGGEKEEEGTGKEKGNEDKDETENAAKTNKISGTPDILTAVQAILRRSVEEKGNRRWL
eukprot:764000-Hanusia_phi.AAC.1